MCANSSVELSHKIFAADECATKQTRTETRNRSHWTWTPKRICNHKVADSLLRPALDWTGPDANTFYSALARCVRHKRRCVAKWKIKTSEHEGYSLKSISKRLAHFFFFVVFFRLSSFKIYLITNLSLSLHANGFHIKCETEWSGSAFFLTSYAEQVNVRNEAGKHQATPNSQHTMFTMWYLMCTRARACDALILRTDAAQTCFDASSNRKLKEKKNSKIKRNPH